MKITVSLPIVVPSGKYCWRYDGNGGPCVHFDNEVYYPGECTLFKRDLSNNKDGVVKLEKCLSLKEKE